MSDSLYHLLIGAALGTGFGFFLCLAISLHLDRKTEERVK